MRITVGVTDNAWARYLHHRDDLVEINFWTPSGRSFMGRAKPDEPFLFKTKSPQNRLVGGGYYVRFWELRVSEAWAAFGNGNGVASEAELAAAIRSYRSRGAASSRDDPDPTIGCIVLRNPFFARVGEGLPKPPRWGNSIVRGKTYDPADPDYGYVEHAFRAFQGGARVDLAWDTDLRGVDLDDDRRYGEPVLTRPRLGQASFRLTVLDAYEQRCAITGSRAVPALEAAHIRDYARGGRHLVSNGLALRSDIHRLYDRGYVGIDPDLKLRVSPRLKAVYGNGDDLYAMEKHGQVVRPPRQLDHHPDREALAWHMETVFLSA